MMASDTHWRCERASDGDVKYAAKPDHKAKLEAGGYTCAVVIDLDFDSFSPPIPPVASPDPDPEPSVPTTLDPARTEEDIVLSNGNLTATAGPTEPGTESWTTTSRGTGVRYFEVTVNSVLWYDGWCYLGMFPANQVLPPEDYAGNIHGWQIEFQNWEEIGWYYKVSGEGWNNATDAWFYEEGMVVGVEINFNTSTVRMRANTGPSAGEWVGQFTVPDEGDMYIVNNMFESQCTYNFGASPFVMPTEEGAVSWDEE